MHATKVSGKHLSMPTQFKFNVKNVSVATYGLRDVVSGFGASTLNVAQQSDTVSTLKTVDSPSVPSSVYGIVHNVLFPQVYNDTGLVLNAILFMLLPKNGLSQEPIV